MNSEQLMLRYAEQLLRHGDREAMERAAARFSEEAQRDRLECWQPSQEERERPQ
jgi:hypothetical protein